jgi:hypothetical protein
MAFQPGDRANAERFYDPLATYVRMLPGVQRVEVVPTSTFRQADELAMEISLARGWDTQLDRKHNAQLYDAGLDATSYHQWLSSNAVSLVALPLGPLQHTAHFETDVIRTHPAYLQPVWSDGNWQVYRVTDTQPLATNGARVIAVQPESLTINAPKAGRTLVRYRYTTLYRTDPAVACLSPTTDGWIDVHVRRPGIVRLHIRLDASSITGGGTSAC